MATLAEAAPMNGGAPNLGHGWVAFIVATGFLAAAITAILTCAAVAWRSPLGRPLRYLWRRVVGEPLKTFFQETVGDIVEAHTAPLRHELTPNGGSSLVDKVDHMVETQSHVRADQADQNAKLDVLGTKVTDIRHKVIDVAGLEHLSAALGSVPTVVGALTALADEVTALRQAITQDRPKEQP